MSYPLPGWESAPQQMARLHHVSHTHVSHQPIFVNSGAEVLRSGYAVNPQATAARGASVAWPGWGVAPQLAAGLHHQPTPTVSHQPVFVGQGEIMRSGVMFGGSYGTPQYQQQSQQFQHQQHQPWPMINPARVQLNHVQPQVSHVPVPQTSAQAWPGWGSAPGAVPQLHHVQTRVSHTPIA
eukprot:TRINITY_DN844_c0_g1_i1.p3 TRINITY_DN844_c0_g1~~TRINITY_DN844_c0_g1_i1.p3  ORF type:complete len:181 (+),score=38.41 TRINITY_DN844_c0_g1_i1:3-545(+)